MKMTPRGLLIVGGLIYALWGAVVALSALGWNPLGLDWNFENTGQLGDSFGILGAAMAGLAAYFAFKSYQQAKKGTDDLIARQDAKDQADRQQASEATFFKLLDLRANIVGGTSIGNREALSQGHEAFERMAKIFRSTLKGLDEEASREAYQKKYDFRRGELGHYYRLTYHTVLFAHESFENAGGTSYKYVRLLRSLLSNNELILIALTCALGEGQGKFKRLVEQYALLHNLHAEDIETLGLRRWFSEQAFDHQILARDPLSVENATS